MFIRCLLLQDAKEDCKRWASSGECDNNPDYMIGDGGLGLGACRAACQACEACAPGDAPCRARNRERAGFLAIDKLD